MFPGFPEDGEATSDITLEKIDRLLDVTDLVMLDIKHIRDEDHRKLTGHSNKNILAFARYLDQKKKPVWIRHVVVPGITFEKAELTLSKDTFQYGKIGSTAISCTWQGQV